LCPYYTKRQGTTLVKMFWLAIKCQVEVFIVMWSCIVLNVLKLFKFLEQKTFFVFAIMCVYFGE